MEEEKTTIIKVNDKPHSYEFGKAQNRHKIYYNDVEELKAHVQALKEAGFTDEFID